MSVLHSADPCDILKRTHSPVAECLKQVEGSSSPDGVTARSRDHGLGDVATVHGVRTGRPSPHLSSLRAVREATPRSIARAALDAHNAKRSAPRAELGERLDSTGGSQEAVASVAVFLAVELCDEVKPREDARAHCITHAK